MEYVHIIEPKNDAVKVVCMPKQENHLRLKKPCANCPFRKEGAISTSDQHYVNLAQKIDGVTWGKRSRKNGDFGWLPSIPSWCLKQFREGGELPFGIYTTRLAALKFAKASLQEEVQYCENELKKLQAEEETQQLQEELTENQRLLKTAASMVKREQNNNKRG